MGQHGGHINQRLANFVISKQLLAWEKKNLRDYKIIYLASKAYSFLEL